MPRMLRFQLSSALVPSAFALLLAAPLAGLAQNQYCNAGVHPDAFVAFDSAPPAPATVNGTLPGSTFPLSLRTLNGENVSLTVPPVTVPAGRAGYIATTDTFILNGVDRSNDPTVTTMTLTFAAAPVKGVRLNAITQEPSNTDQHGFFIQATSQDGHVFYTGSADTNTTAAPGGYYVTPLQVEAPDALIQSVSISLIGSSSNATFGLTDVRVEGGGGPNLRDQVPLDGLQQWLRADSGVTSDSTTGQVTAWQDGSGNNHSATASSPTSGPQLALGGSHCQPTLAFGTPVITQPGASPTPMQSSLNFNLPIAGWTQMTVFLVAQSHDDPGAGQFGSENSAIFWNENQYWGNTYVSPFQSHTTFRFGTTQVGNDPNFTWPILPAQPPFPQRQYNAGGDFALTTAVHDGTTDSLAINGVTVLTQTGKLAALGGTTGAGTIGAGFNNTFYNGEISEILIYNRVLTTAERSAVESYLRSKYGLF